MGGAIAGICMPLKRKEPRLRDWNKNSPSYSLITNFGLKRKEPRLRDWNSGAAISAKYSKAMTWKEKNLDYEIETYKFGKWNSRWCSDLKRKEPRLRDWNFGLTWTIRGDLTDLKRKEPRLRDWNETWPPPWPPCVPTWKEKNLDYEIETHPLRPRHQRLRRPWKEKNLDYEIETDVRRIASKRCGRLEKKRTSITRLKPAVAESVVIGIGNLKRKEPRLRDWNFDRAVG